MKFDVIIYCSGYKISFPFFEKDLVRIETQPYRVGLYKHVWPLDLPGLVFLGIISANGSIHPVAEKQGKTATTPSPSPPSPSFHTLHYSSSHSQRLQQQQLKNQTKTAEWYAKVANGKAKLPLREEMAADIEDWAEGIRKYKVTYRPLQISVDSYLADLDRTIAEGLRQQQEQAN